MIKEDRWEDARLFWTKSFYEEKETKRIKKARLAYNIALACEFTDNIEEANIWINKACEILPSSASANLIEGFQSYKVDLYKRLRSKTMLTKALSE